METHEARVKSVEELIHRHHLGTSHGTSNNSSDVSSHPRTDDSFTPRGHDSVPQHNHVVEASTKTIMDRQAVSVLSRGGPKIEYSEWRPGGADDVPMNAQDEAEFSLRTNYLGHCALIPDDGRLPLNFHRNPNLAPGMVGYVDALTRARMLEALRTFDTEHRTQPDNDFCIVDFDTYNNSRIYRVGEDAMGNELMVTTESTYDAPWSRLILYQGMTTGNSIKGEFDSGFADPIRYFQRAGASPGLWDHIFSHLRLKRRSSTVNPYASGHQGFHTIFYDIRETKHIEAKELWKHGPLYDHPLGWYVRKCAYTLYCPPNLDEDGDFERNYEMAKPHWTMLVLAPGGFFDEDNTSFPTQPLSKGRAQALGHCLGRLTRAGAELNLIGQGLARISEKWAEFQSFFDYILDNGDSLMHPTEHDNLLFDDGSFSRSRRFFWAIDCLAEFESAISDNINQWESYKSALPVLENDLDNIQLKNVERQCRLLQIQREYFRQKLASTRALRDALFSASAVIESRASTRLGENVKLLTFVSVFFIPLSFCTSLWSINNMFSSDALIAVIIVVALLTYTTVLNINSIVHSVSILYDTKKRRVINAMKRDERESWRYCGQQFESFRPKHENPKPSEWYITLYALFNPAAVLGIPRRSKYSGPGDDPNEKPPAKFFGIPNGIWRRRKAQAKDPELPDEPWVL
ncbi:MAG: hypothetical protein LQ350_003433 [Teloschistes chrysophthalmus]|nr:MAG: hypothetical protein LQ350_003433 [Niorma chrysophthalma]